MTTPRHEPPRELETEPEMVAKILAGWSSRQFASIDQPAVSRIQRHFGIADVDPWNILMNDDWNPNAETTPRTTAPAWQPIETAPKDGTHVLLSGGDLSGFVFVGLYDEQSGGGWLILEAADAKCSPRFWMPAPEPPKEDAP